ncbi:NAD(P)/FAD-dependent oxidoreductase [Pseudomonas mangiferae]|uniref:NAD(P)/FAD-dependent oxidoreductase n=1 Tax=Pseudomonas mangiferae TaxID=2593654 RepID=A0A553H555_9PSED|nr:NAD(P)/FAD-dependent oxidoreductase [Pseudomonas mangiferae]
MTKRSSIAQFDAIVIGAGLSGLYATHKLGNELGLKVLGLEKARSVGGTWYWNRYPGVQADTDSFVYRYSFDREASPGWDMHARYQTGAQIRDYLENVASRNDLSRLYRFEVEAREATYDEADNLWRVKTSHGDVVTCRYLVNGVGVLSKPVAPKIEGLDDFKGRVVHTARWPEGLRIDGLRVGLLGTGSTGTQVAVAASKVASHLTVFQRSAQYVVPAGQRRHTDTEVDSFLSHFDENFREWRKTRLACGFEEPATSAAEASPEERKAVFEHAWNEGGGFGFMFGTFGDLVINPDSNRAACEFIVGKIKQIVRDPETARRLTPSEPYAKRPVSVDGYYEAFNQPNVKLVSIQETPIVRVTENGILTADGVEHEIDILILATGFEAVEGAYRDFNVIGRNGRTLLDTWGEHPAAYLGLSTPGFPNLFTVLGPQGIFSNLAAGIEAEVNFIGDAIRWAEDRPGAAIEATPEALSTWSEQCSQMANYTVFAQVKSWIFGTNVHSNQPRVLFYFGGLKEYLSILDHERTHGFPGFTQAGSPSLTLVQSKADATDDEALRQRNYATVERYMHSLGQDRLTRHHLFQPDGICGLWTTETGKPIKIHGHQSMAEHAAWSLKCLPDWKWYNIRIHPGQDPNIFWVECEGRGEIHFPGYPVGDYHNHFIFSFEMKDGLIARAREFMNPTEQMRALRIPVPVIRREGIPKRHDTPALAE